MSVLFRYFINVYVIETNTLLCFVFRIGLLTTTPLDALTSCMEVKEMELLIVNG